MRCLIKNAFVLAILVAVVTVGAGDAYCGGLADGDVGDLMIGEEMAYSGAGYVLSVEGTPVSRDECFGIGADTQESWPGINRYRGNVLLIEEDATLSEFRVKLSGTSQVTLYFTVHERCGAETSYTKIWESEQVVTVTPTASYYSSGPILGATGLPLTIGCEYAVGVAWGGTTIAYWRDDPPSDYPMDFDKGQILGGGFVNTAPPVETLLPGGSFPWAFGATVMEVCFLPEPGACCIGGSCQELLINECFAAGGTFSSPGTTCGEIPGCPLQAQACCFGESCAEINPYLCVHYGGEPSAQLTCTPNPCEPTGACCLGDGCNQMYEGDCVEQGGIYRGDDTTCDTIDPACTAGACCINESLCLNLPETQCDATNGLYLGNGLDCADDPCGATGACCTGVDCVDAQSRFACEGGGGVLVEGAACDDDPAPCVECTPESCPDDGLYCNGVEGCDGGVCVSSGYPCSADQYCDEISDSCLECIWDFHCDDGDPCVIDQCVGGSCAYALATEGSPCPDGIFCNGEETCTANGDCVSPGDPCGVGYCDELSGSCLECLENEHCDDGNPCNDTYECVDGACEYTFVDEGTSCEDGLYCNGDDECSAEGECLHSGDPCGDALVCHEGSDSCLGCAFDLDHSGFVGTGDINLIKAYYGAVTPETAAFDLDGSGFVGTGDINLLKANYGECVEGACAYGASECVVTFEWDCVDSYGGLWAEGDTCP